MWGWEGAANQSHSDKTHLPRIYNPSATTTKVLTKKALIRDTATNSHLVGDHK